MRPRHVEACEAEILATALDLGVAMHLGDGDSDDTLRAALDVAILKLLVARCTDDEGDG